MTNFAPIHVLSLGGGIQSTTLALMSTHKVKGVPAYDFAIFSDTGWESVATLEHLKVLSRQIDFPIHMTSNGNLLDDLRDGLLSPSYFTPPPFFHSSGSISQRQCTTDYKIVPIRRKLRELLGAKTKARIFKSVCMSIGISLDECHRAKPSNVQYITHIFPLLEQRLTRLDCENWLKRNGYQVPVKSSCVGCPFHSNQEWQRIKTDFCLEFQTVIEIDELLRSRPSPEFMHKQLKPIGKIQFINERQIDLWGNECSGLCGV